MMETNLRLRHLFAATARTSEPWMRPLAALAFLLAVFFACARGGLTVPFDSETTVSVKLRTGLRPLATIFGWN